MPLARRLVLILALSLLPACGGGGGDGGGEQVHPLFTAANAYYVADAARGIGVPPDAMEPDAFVALVESGEYQLVSAQGIANDRDADLEQGAADHQAALQAHANLPHILAALQSPIPQDHPDVDLLPDGNVRWRTRGAQGGPEDTFILGGNPVTARLLLDARDRLPTRANQDDAYRSLFEALPQAYIDGNQLPTPESLANQDLTFVTGLNDTIATDWQLFQHQPGVTPPPPGWPQSWREEEGAGETPATARGLDRIGPEGLPQGLWSQVDFPLKWCATHVRAQGNRGLCAFFAVTAAVEARFAAQRGRWVNLSEQTFYNQTRRVWAPSHHGDAGWPSVEMWYAQANAFTWPFERSWDYNPSWWRTDHPDQSVYIQSCWANPTGTTTYPGPWCSDANHQSPGVCTAIGSTVYCATRDPGPWLLGPGMTSGIGVRRWITVADGNIAARHDLAKMLLNLKMPIAYCFDVPDQGFGPGPSGICTNETPRRPGVGSHCVVLLGYLRNADLPAGVPPAAGGGYYIGKNSWGTNNHDRGYFYASDLWIETYGYAMFAVTSVHG